MTTQPSEATVDRLSFDKVMYLPDHLRRLVAGEDAYPIHMQIGPVNYCNHDCTFCYAARSMFDAQNEPRTRIDVERLLRIVEEMHGLGLRAVTLVGAGEPTLHPRIADIIEGITDRGVEVGLFTNGSCLTDKSLRAIVDCCTFVRFSMTGATPDVHHLVHANGDFERVVENIRRVSAARHRRFPTLGSQFILASYSAPDVIDAVRLARSLGLDYFEIKPCYVAPDKPDQLENTLSSQEAERLIEEALALSDDGFRVYGKVEQHRAVAAGVDDRSYDDCPGHQSTAVLEADLNLYICVNHKTPDFAFGNLAEQTFRKVWHGRRRRDILDGLCVHECQPRCRQDPLNRLVQEIRVGDRTIPLNLPEPDPETHPYFV